MSNSHGAVRFNSDGLILYYEYQGTIDYVTNRLRDSVEEVENNWRGPDRSAQHNPECKLDEEVRIASTYGGGFSWSGRACRYCKLITLGFEPHWDDEPEYEDGIPEWYPNREAWLL